MNRTELRTVRQIDRRPVRADLRPMARDALTAFLAQYDDRERALSAMARVVRDEFAAPDPTRCTVSAAPLGRPGVVQTLSKREAAERAFRHRVVE